MSTKKRVSGAGQRSVLSRFQRTCGIDTDIKFLVAGIFDISKDIIEVLEFEQSQVGYEKLRQWLVDHRVEYIIIESTGNYHMPAYDFLSTAGLNIQVINPIIVKSLLRVEGKSDKGDAATLARLAASFDLKTSNIPRMIERELRAHTRNLEALRARKIQITNKMQSDLYGWGVTVFRQIKLESVSGLLIVEGLILGMTVQDNVMRSWKGAKAKRSSIESSLTALTGWQRDFLSIQYAELQSIVRELESAQDKLTLLVTELDLDPLVDLLTTAPAVSRHLATVILAEMGINFWERYHSASAFAKAIGVVPGNQVSGGKIVKRKTVHGNEHIKFALLNAVKGWNLHARKDNELKIWLENYRKRASWNKAISGVARQIAESLYHMGRTKQPYCTKAQHKLNKQSSTSDNKI